MQAVLETIRALMNAECVVPDWLHDTFLGYGDPSAANYTRYCYSLTLGAHAQEGYGTCPVCLFVCLSVRLLPLSCQHRSFLRSKYGTYGTCLGFPSFLTRGFSKKTFRWKVMARKSQYANEQLLLATGFSPFRVSCIHQ